MSPLGALFTVIALLLTQPLWTPQIHVATTGSDASGTGAPAAPFRTIAAAVGAASDDDELVFAAGHYWEEAQPVTISANLTITGAGKGITIINNTLLELRFDGTFVMQELTLEFTEPAYSGLLAEAWQAQPFSPLSTPTLQLINIQLHSSLAVTQFTITNPTMRVTASGVDATNAALYACGVAAATVSDSTFTFTGFTPASTYTESTSMLNLCAATVIAQRVDFTANSFYRPAAAHGCFHLEAQTSGSVEDCTFTHCGTAGFGGGLAVVNSNGVMLQSSTFSNTVAEPNSLPAQGGCLAIQASSTITVHNTAFTSCSAHDGGGAIGVFSSTDVAIRDCDITNGTTPLGDGGAILAVGPFTTVVVEDTRLSDSHASYGRGGAVAVLGADVMLTSTTPQGLTIDNCSASLGGAIAVAEFSTLTLSGARITGCRAARNGGGLLVVDGASATVGAAASSAPADAASANVAISSCAAAASGGGLFVDGATINLQGAAITGCTAHDDGGGAQLANVASPSVLQGVLVKDCDSSVDNVDQDGVGGGLCVRGVVGSSTAPPTLVPARMTIENCHAGQSRGGSGGGIALVSVRSAVSSSSISLIGCSSYRGGGLMVSSSAHVAIDQLSLQDCTAVDVGGGAAMVASTNITLSGLTASGCSAVKAGGALSAQAASVYILDSSSIQDNTAVQYGGCMLAVESDVSLLAGSNIANCRCTKGRGGGGFVQLGNITLQSAAVTNCHAFGEGGAMYIGNARASIHDTAFTSNSASGGGALAANLGDIMAHNTTFMDSSARSGGAVLATRGTFHVVRGTFTNNEGADGGGAAVFDEVTEVSITRSSFDLNSAVLGTGGALLARARPPPFLGDAKTLGLPMLTITDSTFSSSIGAAYGGALFVTGYVLNAVSIQRCTFADNTALLVAVTEGAMQGGGAIAIDSVGLSHGPASISDCSFTNNRALAGADVRLRQGLGCGGAIYAASSGVVVQRSNFTSNSAHFGGGLCELVLSARDPTAATVQDNAFTSCSAEQAGGAVYWLEDEPPRLTTSNRFTGNSVSPGYGPDVASPATQLHVVHRVALEHNSGHPLEAQPQLHLHDHYNQTANIGYEGTSGIATAADETIVLSGDTTLVINQGVSSFSGLAVGGALGSAGVINYRAGVGATELRAMGRVTFRFCRRGETQEPTRCVPCVRGTFSWSNVDSECERCPGGAVCQGGDSVIAQANYWRMSNTSRGMLDQVTERYSLLPCRTSFSCIGAPEDAELVGYNGTEGCAEGYQGNLCLRCVHGYGRSGAAGCGKCPNPIWNRVLLAVAMVVIVVIAAVSVVTTLASASSSKSELSMMNKALLSFLQIASLASIFRVQWPETIVSIMSTFQSTSSAAADQMMSLDCLLDEGDDSEQSPLFLQKTLIGVLQPAMYLLGACIVWGLVYLKRIAIPRWRNAITLEVLDDNSDGNVDEEELQEMLGDLGVRLNESELMYLKERCQRDPSGNVVVASQATIDGMWQAMADFNKEKLIVTVVVLMFMAHPAVSTKTLLMFTCMELDDGNTYLRDDLDLECWTGVHLDYILFVAVPSLIVWCIGIPLGGFLLLWYNKTRYGLDAQHVKNKLNFLYGGLLPKYYYWELVIQFRKILFVGVAVLFEPLGALPQGLAGLLVLFIAVLIHQMALPFKSDVLDKLERMSLLCSFLLLYCGVFFFAKEHQSAASVWVGIIAMALVSVTFIVYWLYCARHEFMRIARTVLAKVKGLIHRKKKGEGLGKRKRSNRVQPEGGSFGSGKELLEQEDGRERELKEMPVEGANGPGGGSPATGDASAAPAAAGKLPDAAAAYRMDAEDNLAQRSDYDGEEEAAYDGPPRGGVNGSVDADEEEEEGTTISVHAGALNPQYYDDPAPAAMEAGVGAGAGAGAGAGSGAHVASTLGGAAAVPKGRIKLEPLAR